MSETTYRVTDINGNVLAEGMALEMVFAFIRGYNMTFFNERLSLSIEAELEVTR